MVVRLRAAGWLLVLTLVACSGPGVRPPERSDGPPDHTPVDLAKLPDPIPREEPKSARGNPPSYTVLDLRAGYRLNQQILEAIQLSMQD